MQAIILAAGMGKRLGEYTQNNTKCMVRVGGEESMRMESEDRTERRNKGIYIERN